MSSSEQIQIEIPEWFNPDYPPLRKDNVGQAAVNGQVVSYPKVVRDNVDPLPRGQDDHVVNFSFMMLDEPKPTRDGGKLYGMGIIRGHHNSHAAAVRDAERLTRTHDSRNQIMCVPQGSWFYLTSDPKAYSEVINVDVNKSQEDDEKLREAQRKRVEEQQRIAREIKEKEEAMRTAKDIRDDPESLDYYTMKRVTYLSLREERENLDRKVESLKTVTKKLMKELDTLDNNHPDYTELWVENYNKARVKVGIPPFVPSEKEEQDYIDTKNELAPDDSSSSEVVKL